MGLKSKQIQMRQKEYFEQQLQNRLSFLSEKGIESSRVDKDPHVKKIKADIRAVNNRLRLIAENEKRTEEMAKAKAERAAAAAAPPKQKESGKAEKPKKAPGEGKERKVKAEKKAGPAKAPEGGKNQKPAETPDEGKPPIEKKTKETREEPAGREPEK
jgi:hypothetical protein